MNCQQFEHYLDPYLDGELNGTLKLEFEAHLVECEPCGHLYAMMEAVGQIVESPSPDEPRLSADFADRVMLGIADRRMKNLRFRKILAASSVAASIALILTGLVLFTSTRPAPVTSPQLAPRQIVHAPIAPEPAFLTVNNLQAEQTQAKAYFEVKNTFTPSPEPAPALAAADQRLEQQQVQEELNQWLATKLERAGMNLWEITQLRSTAWNQMRQGLFKSLTPPVRPVDLYLPMDHMAMPVVPARLDGLNDFAPMPQDEVALEPGIELL